MTDQQYAQLILDELQAKAEHEADPASNEKYNNYFTLHRTHRQEQRNRMDRRFREKYPVVQFERQPDEGLL